jgi:hypothetical protein
MHRDRIYIRKGSGLRTMNFFKEDSHLSDEAVALYVDALKFNTVGQVPETIRDHLSECAECKTEVEGLFLLLEDEKYELNGQHPFFRLQPELAKKGIALTYRIAAVFLLAVGVYGVFYLYRHKLDENAGKNVAQNASKVEESKNTSVTKRSDKSLADNFVELPLLEDLVKAEYRSMAIQIEAPALGEEVGKNITFKWAQGPGKGLILRIIDNAGKDIHSVRTAENGYVFKGSLRPGLYYWKLESKDELLFVGKFLKK